MQKSTLSRTRLPHDREHLSSLHFKRKILKEHQIRLAGSKNLFQTNYTHYQIFIYWMQLTSLSFQPAAHGCSLRIRELQPNPLPDCDFYRFLYTSGSDMHPLRREACIPGTLYPFFEMSM